jgi:hypothetical protein
MGYSRAGWTIGILAPWCLGMALTVSISAGAGEDFLPGLSVVPLPLRAAPPHDLIPANAPPGAEFVSPAEARQLIHAVSLSIGGVEEFKRVPDEIEPRAHLKRNASVFPQVDRSHKGDPLAGLRPELDSKLRTHYNLIRLGRGDGFRPPRKLAPSSFSAPEDQNRQHYGVCQFSYASNGPMLVTEPEAWLRAVRIPTGVASGTTYLSEVGGSTHFHALRPARLGGKA